MDVYGDNANIIPEEIPELLSYMEEVMPEKSRDDNAESGILDTMVNMDKFLSGGCRKWKQIEKSHKINTNLCLFCMDKKGVV